MIRQVDLITVLKALRRRDKEKWGIKIKDQISNNIVLSLTILSANVDPFIQRPKLVMKKIKLHMNDSLLLVKQSTLKNNSLF